MSKIENDGGGLPADESHEKFLWYFTKERHRIHAFIFSLLPITEEAEDVFQQTSVKLWKKFHLFNTDREFYPWACGFAYNEVRSYWRIIKRQKTKLGVRLFSEELIQKLADHRLANTSNERLRHELLDECLANLKERDRNLLSKIYKDGISPSDYAASMNLAVRSVYNRMSFVRKKLMECVERKMGVQRQTGDI